MASLAIVFVPPNWADVAPRFQMFLGEYRLQRVFNAECRGVGGRDYTPSVLDGSYDTPVLQKVETIDGVRAAIEAGEDIQDLDLASAPDPLFKEALRQGADVNSALHEAARNISPDRARALIERGANVHTLDENGLTPLDAVFSGVNYLTHSGSAALVSAYLIEEVDQTIDILFDAGATLSVSGPSERDRVVEDIDKALEGLADFGRTMGDDVRPVLEKIQRIRETHGNQPASRVEDAPTYGSDDQPEAAPRPF